MPDREFTCFNNEQLERAIDPDMALAVDKPWEIMAEEYGIPLSAARRIHAWHTAQMERAADETRFRTLSLAIGWLLMPAKNHVAKLWGLAFSFGLASRMNGVENMTLKALEMGVTRALISHYKRQCDRELESEVRLYGKSAAACAKYRESRVAYVQTGLTKAQRLTNGVNGSQDFSEVSRDSSTAGGMTNGAGRNGGSNE